MPKWPLLALTLWVAHGLACASGQAPSFARVFAQGKAALAKHDFAGAKRLFEICLADAGARNDLEDEAKALSELALVAGSRFDYKAALEDDQRALAIRQSLGKPNGIVFSATNVAIDLVRLERYDEALTNLRQVREIAHKSGNLRDEANSLNNISVVYYEEEKFAMAIPTLVKALAIWRKVGAPGPIADCLNRLTVGYASLQQFDRALECAGEGLQISRKANDQIAVALGLAVIGETYSTMKQYDKALDCQQQALAIRGKHEPDQIADSLCEIAELYGYLGQFKKQIDVLLRALDIQLKTKDPDAAKTLQQLARIYLSLKELDKACDYELRELALARKQGDPADLVQSLNETGLAFIASGQFDRALTYIQEAQETLAKVTSPTLAAEGYSRIGVAYESMGQIDKAREYEEKALDLRRPLPDSADYAESLFLVATEYRLEGDPGRSLPLAEEAHERLIKARDFGWASLSMSCEGADYGLMGHFDKALELQLDALKEEKKLGSSYRTLDMVAELAFDYASLGHYDLALECQKQVVETTRQMRNPVAIAAADQILATYLAESGKTKDANDAFTEAVSIYEGLAGQALGDPSEEGAFQQGTVGDLYDRFAAFRVSEGRLSEALELADRGRAQGLSRQINFNRKAGAGFLSLTDASLLKDCYQDFTSGSANLRALNERMVGATAGVTAILSKEAAAASKEVADAERRYDLTREALLSKNPVFEQISGKGRKGGEDFIALAQRSPDSLYLEFVVLNNKALVFALWGSKGLKVTELPLTRQGLEAEVKAYLSAVQNDPGGEAALSSQLYKELIAPIDLESDPEIKRIVVVAGGPLLDLPFCSLRDPSGRRLIERYALSGAVSLDSFLWPLNSLVPTRSLLVVADPTGEGGSRVENGDRGSFGPLPYARAEGTEIAARVPGSLELVGNAANEGEVTQEMPTYALLHFACHGEFISSHPLHSALVLAKDEGSGFLEAEDILGMKLSAGLAVLSACDTGKGALSGGEGLMGLTWAFQAAGVPAVVASKWEVDDAATKRLMVRFYSELLAGARKDDALRTAILAEMTEQEKPEHARSPEIPGSGKRSSAYYWAAFQILGDCSPLKSLPR